MFDQMEEFQSEIKTTTTPGLSNDCRPNDLKAIRMPAYFKFSSLKIWQHLTYYQFVDFLPVNFRATLADECDPDPALKSLLQQVHAPRISVAMIDWYGVVLTRHTQLTDLKPRKYIHTSI